MTLQSGLNLVLLGGGVVVDNGVDGLVFSIGAFDLVEEANKLLMPVTLHILANHGAIQHIQGREQGRHTVTFAIMGHRRAASLLQRQSRLGPVFATSHQSTRLWHEPAEIRKDQRYHAVSPQTGNRWTI